MNVLSATELNIQTGQNGKFCVTYILLQFFFNSWEKKRVGVGR